MEHKGSKAPHTGKDLKIKLDPIGSLFRSSWSMYQERFGVLVEIILLPVLILILGYILLALGRPFSFVGLIAILVGQIIFVFSSLAVVFSVHHNTGVDESYRGITRWFWPLVWLAVLDIFIVLGGFIMFIIPGIFLVISFTFSTYVLIIENRRGLDVLRQSKDYIKGYWWPVFIRLVLLMIIFVDLSAIVQLPFLLISGKMLQGVVSMIVALFVVPFSIIYEYKIFENLRSLKPHLATTETNKGRGLLKATGIVGLVAIGLLFILSILALAGSFYMSDGGYNDSAPPPSSLQQ